MIIKNGLAACVNIIPNVVSIYEWKDEIHEDQEVIVWIKTKKASVKHIEKKFKEYHPYEVPAFIVYEMHSGSKEFLLWIDQQTKYQSKDTL